tara:strand:- start:396 stop:617 length:222 start_codon:yes stop_codon:yes gene_type:complete
MLPNLFNGGRLSNEKNQFLDFKVRGHKMGRSDGFDDSKKIATFSESGSNPMQKNDSRVSGHAIFCADRGPFYR